ncbi:MAG: alpha-amylase family protein [Planctomycetota bacterium]
MSSYPSSTLRFRQIHLDYHTSPAIPHVAAEFDPDRFADALVRAHVDSVTVFARCHHGHLYYPSPAHPERVHPHLQRPDLLRAQIEACHARGIRTPIYTTIQWDQFTADAQPGWLMLDEAGRFLEASPPRPGFYRYLDVAHPGYRAFLERHIADLFEQIPVDGLFFDIVQPQFSYAEHWLERARAEGRDPRDFADRRAMACAAVDDWKHDMTAFVRGLPGYTEDCTLFYNAGHIGPRHLHTRDAYTHYEIESLPSGGWGYLHYPLTSRFVRTLGKPHLGMTGKFHTSWGDFHSYKNRAALEFECFHALALGSGCSIGDQLHPAGELDDATYRLIGGVYGSVEQKEPWCRDALPCSEIGVLTPEEFESASGDHIASHESQPEAALGAVRVLQELHLQFDMISTAHDFSAYRLLVLPDAVPIDDALARRLDAYLEQGGKLLATHASGLTPQRDRFAGDWFGARFVGELPYEPDFFVPDPSFAPEGSAGDGPVWPGVAYAMYDRGMQIELDANTDAQVLGRIEPPHFNRTAAQFCSHLHAPSTREPAYVGAVQRGGAVYFAHPLFTGYHRRAPLWCKQLIAAAIARLLPDPLVTTDGPSTMIAVLNRQPSAQRLMLHVLHYVPERRGQAFDTIEQVLPLHEVRFELKLPHPDRIQAVTAVPQSSELPYERGDDGIAFTLPRVDGHAMVEVVGDSLDDLFRYPTLESTS